MSAGDAVSDFGQYRTRGRWGLKIHEFVGRPMWMRNIQMGSRKVSDKVSVVEYVRYKEVLQQFVLGNVNKNILRYAVKNERTRISIEMDIISG